jgi:hypothetical protein
MNISHNKEATRHTGSDTNANPDTTKYCVLTPRSSEPAKYDVILPCGAVQSMSVRCGAYHAVWLYADDLHRPLDATRMSDGRR